MRGSEVQSLLDTYLTTAGMTDDVITLSAPDYAPPMPDDVRAAVLAALEARRAGGETASTVPAENAPAASFTASAEGAPEVDPVVLVDVHLGTLYCVIEQALDAGLLPAAARVPDDMMPIVHRAYAPETPLEECRRTVRRAGDAAVAAYAIREYRRRLDWLDSQGASSFRQRATLEVLLAEDEAQRADTAAGRMRA